MIDMRTLRILSTSFIFLVVFALASNGKTKYQLSINASDFVGYYDNTEHEVTTTATEVDPSDPNNPKTFEVTLGYYNVKYENSSFICFNKGNGCIYNKTNLGKITEKVSYYIYSGISSVYVYYGNRTKPYDSQSINNNNNYGFFQIINLSNGQEAKLDNIIIKFEIDDTPTTITLDENSADNNTTISSNGNKVVNVALKRSVTEDMWNAICLPFSMTTDQMTTVFGEGYHLQEFSSVSTENGGTQLQFQEVSGNSVAGTPYIIYPTKSISSGETVSIDGVTISSSAPTTVEKTDRSDNTYTYQGIYVPTVLEKGNKSIIFIGANNKFYWPNTDSPMKAFRAYFTLPSQASSSNISLSTEDQGVTDRIQLSEIQGIEASGNIYSIHGQYVGNSPNDLPKGLYITNGHKFIVK